VHGIISVSRTPFAVIQEWKFIYSGQEFARTDFARQRSARAFRYKSPVDTCAPTFLPSTRIETSTQNHVPEISILRMVLGNRKSLEMNNGKRTLYSGTFYSG
jgi:hypothetical protein